eukprot:scpid28639/ scgid14361/ 
MSVLQPCRSLSLSLSRDVFDTALEHQPEQHCHNLFQLMQDMFVEAKTNYGCSYNKHYLCQWPSSKKTLQPEKSLLVQLLESASNSFSHTEANLRPQSDHIHIAPLQLGQGQSPVIKLLHVRRARDGDRRADGSWRNTAT